MFTAAEQEQLLDLLLRANQRKMRNIVVNAFCANFSGNGEGSFHFTFFMRCKAGHGMPATPPPPLRWKK